MELPLKNQVIIVAGGSGTRMQSQIPKQFLPLGGKTVLMHTITIFRKYDPNIKIILVLPKAQIDTWNNLCVKHEFKNVDKVVIGGVNRFLSVKNGLSEIEENTIIGVHDGVRPFVSLETISNCYSAAKEYGAAIPVMDVQESLRFSDRTSNYSVHRSSFKIVQTPQVFASEILLDAYNKAENGNGFTDDASVVEKNGTSIHLVEGNRENIKITTRFDLLIGEAFLNG